MQWFRKKDGFTLVEMIVTLAIMAILLTVAGNALLFGNRMYTETEVKNREKSIGDTVFKAIENQLVYATKIEILPNDRTTQ
ncbi:type II secretion system protein [Eubacterium aggregans]|uniref:type II secretion system protein n=1 Tax=Eubacterium aggregans TaxID=81409 RepID=UPI003F33F889